MRRLLFLLRAWLRYRGWRNVYWREDAYMAACPHTGRWYFDEAGSLCVDCGAPLYLWGYGVEQTTGSSNTNVRVRVFPS